MDSIEVEAEEFETEPIAREKIEFDGGIFTIPNFLSLMRIPLAFLFLHDSIWLRCFAIIFAMISDGLDGYLARRYQMGSRFGTVLDPLTDKFFVIFLLTVLIGEGRLSYGAVAAMLCRDFSVLIFGGYLFMTGKLAAYRFRSIWSGKITTCLQFIVLLGVTLQYTIPGFIYFCFIVFGFMAWVELNLTQVSIVITAARSFGRRRH